LNEHQLEHTRFLVTHHWKEVQNFILNYKKRFKKTPEMGLIVPSWEILGSLLSKKNQYVGLLPDYIDHFKLNLLKEIKTSFPLTRYEICLMSLSQNEITPLHALFEREFLHEVRRRA
jgi:hypothetical protein